MSDPHPALFPPLSLAQTRVLGCLLEKETLVPDTYPLTLNSLITACNQSTNRDPVTHFSESEVLAALDGLREHQWAFQLSQAGARVPKFKHNLSHKIPDLLPASRALLTTLLLRGPQTSGELRQRCERLHEFPDLASVESELDALQSLAAGPLVVCLPPGSGRRVACYAHLFSGPVDPDVITGAVIVAPPPSPPPAIDPNWQTQIENQIAALQAELRDLKSQLGILQ